MRRRNSQLPRQWQAHSKRPKRSSGPPAWKFAATGSLIGGLAGVAIFFWPQGGMPELWAKPQSLQVSARTFSLCQSGGGTNCVVDGDTIWLDGVKIRVADIDAPETHPPRCRREADLGEKSTNRLLVLVNQGAFETVSSGDRDEDVYGRKLRRLIRNGQSLGDVLVSEGLARTWDGARHPWC